MVWMVWMVMIVMIVMIMMLMVSRSKRVWFVISKKRKRKEINPDKAIMHKLHTFS